ncbi:hypothetical protein [Halodesulfovibrio sp. MK-HDV]|jgi:hypothetical protein|uniref:hypothetical protein n=1 Tax=Halodesulfovibrio sp. MK-HDV TaxID=2599925 RepID=UPI001371CF08|nr:hypothetical protein [Halodesulfovibrio sp. MK-HDV]KAF1073265.1 hypothetical protein MKHDV_03724 [Halodesulfovibrio sp. MK-HDV]
MNFANLLSLAGVAVSLFAVLGSFRSLTDRIQTEHQVQEKIQKKLAEQRGLYERLVYLSCQYNENKSDSFSQKEYEALLEMLIKQASNDLSENQRKAIDAALNQSSHKGRMNYLSKVINKAGLHAA